MYTTEEQIKLCQDQFANLLRILNSPDNKPQHFVALQNLVNNFINLWTLTPDTDVHLQVIAKERTTYIAGKWKFECPVEHLL